MARWDAGAASAALIFASIIGGVVGQTHQTRISLSAAMLARDIVCGAVYQKALRLKPHTVPSGTVTNLMAVDANVVVMTIEFGQYIWFGVALDVKVIKCRFQSKRAQRYIRIQLFPSTFN